MKRIFKLIFRFLFSLLLLFLILKKIPLYEIWEIIKKTNLKFFLLGLSLIILFSFFNSFRLFSLIKILLHQPSQKFSQVLKAYYLGYFYSLFLPSIVGGDFVKGLYLGSKKLSYKEGLTFAFLDRAAGLGGLAILGLIATILIKINDLLIPFPLFIPLIVFMGISLLVFSFIFFSQKLKKLPCLSFLKRVNFSKRKEFVKLIFLSVFFQITNTAATLTASLAVGIRIHPLYFFLYVPFSDLATLLPITISGIGVREISAVWLYGGLEIPQSQIIAMTTVVFSYIVLRGFVGGLLQILS